VNRLTSAKGGKGETPGILGKLKGGAWLNTKSIFLMRLLGKKPKAFLMTGNIPFSRGGVKDVLKKKGEDLLGEGGHYLSSFWGSKKNAAQNPAVRGGEKKRSRGESQNSSIRGRREAQKRRAKPLGVLAKKMGGQIGRGLATHQGWEKVTGKDQKKKI